MSYSAPFEAGLSEFLDGQVLGQVEIDTQAFNTHEDINAKGENWCKMGLRLSEKATTIEDKFAAFQIQSLGILMVSLSHAVMNKRPR